MARGYPDYFGYSMFPYYGDLSLDDSGNVFVAAGDRDPIFELKLKGQIAGGRFYIQNLVSPTLCRFILTVDGIEIMNWSVDDFIHYAVGNAGSIIKAVYYNDVETIFNSSYIKDYSFGNQLKMEVDNGMAVIATVQSRLYYYNVKT